jgi:putative ABC transport system permease protein
MFARIVTESLVRKRGRKLIAVAAVALGAAVATAMLTIALGVGDKVNKELRSYGANIEALPRDRRVAVNLGGIQYQAASSTAYLKEADLPRLKSVFWANNILAFAPFLHAPIQAVISQRSSEPIETMLVGTWFDHEIETEEGKKFRTGVREVNSWWKVDGEWPGKGECLAGSALASRIGLNPGDEIDVRGPVAAPRFRVSGILSTGAGEDDQLVGLLSDAQRLSGLEGRIDRVSISALTNPEDDFARSDPETLTPEQFERWSCTPYARSIAYDVSKVVEGSEARPVMRISQTEGALLSRIELMMLLTAVAALAASILGVSSTMTTTVLERKSEIALLKAIGAGNAGVTAIFLAEAAVVGLAGGLAGFGLGYVVAQLLARTVFNSAIETSGIVAPAVVIISIAVAFAGSAWPLRAALRFQPSVVLKGQ